MKYSRGFTIIEALIFIVIVALFMRVSLYATRTLVMATPNSQKSVIALQTARQCMEYFAGQEIKNGYASITCPSSSVPSFCTAPSGYTISVNITCTTISSDSNYKTITVTVGGASNVTLTLLIAA